MHALNMESFLGIKMKNFTKVLLAAAWLIFIVSDHGVFPSAILMCAGLYAIADVVLKNIILKRR